MIAVKLPEPNAMTLATVSAEGRPSTRVVLIKGCDARGIVSHGAGRGRQTAGASDLRKYLKPGQPVEHVAFSL